MFFGYRLWGNSLRVSFKSTVATYILEKNVFLRFSAFFLKNSNFFKITLLQSSEKKCICILDNYLLSTYRQFHQQFTYKFFVRNVISAAFLQIHVRKKTTFVRKIRTFMLMKLTPGAEETVLRNLKAQQRHYFVDTEFTIEE